jgi:hypothetical protein
MAAANEEVTKPRVISDKVEVITSKVLYYHHYGLVYHIGISV